MLEIHDVAISTVNEAYHSFLLRYDASKKKVYGFVEGKDDPVFYRGAVEYMLPSDWYIDLIIAGSRSKVIEVRSLIDWNIFDYRQIGFFIDRDLSDMFDPLPDWPINVYVTDGYSIENTICSSDTAIRILEEVHNVVDWTAAERSLIVQHVESQISLFQEAMTPLMSQIAIWRRSGTAANLNNLDLGSMFAFGDGALVLRPGYESAEARVDRLCACVGAELSNETELLASETRFRELDGPRKLVRGKYLIWMLASLVNEIHRSISRFVEAYQAAPKSKLAFGPKGVMVVAAARVRLPFSLRTFIEATFLEFVRAIGTKPATGSLGSLANG